MTESTKTAVRAVLRMDVTIDSSEMAAWDRLLRRGSAVSAGTAAPAPLGRVVKADEVAERLGTTVQTVRAYARAGRLVKVYNGDAKGKYALGYTEESVRALLAGTAGAAPAAPATASREG